ncbi:MAG: V-type ATPase subunit [Clostridia bacterium]|nr:V-type ATPase subunit [Clostridia bacterium]
MIVNEFEGKSYEYAIGCIKATSHPPLTKEQLKALSESSARDFEKRLAEFGWGAGFEGTINERIEKELSYAVSFVKDISPDKSLTDLLFFEDDAVNLKLFVKGRLLAQDMTKLAVSSGSIPIEVIRGSVEAWDFTLISEAADKEMADYEKETDPFILSSVCDRAIFLHTLERAKKESSALYDMLLCYGEAKNRSAEARLREMGRDTEDGKKYLLPVSYTSPDFEKESTEKVISDSEEKTLRAMEDLRTGENFAPVAEYFFRKKSESGILRRLALEKTLRTGGEK